MQGHINKNAVIYMLYQTKGLSNKPINGIRHQRCRQRRSNTSSNSGSGHYKTHNVTSAATQTTTL